MKPRSGFWGDLLCRLGIHKRTARSDPRPDCPTSYYRGSRHTQVRTCTRCHIAKGRVVLL